MRGEVDPQGAMFSYFVSLVIFVNKNLVKTASRTTAKVYRR